MSSHFFDKYRIIAHGLYLLSIICLAFMAGLTLLHSALDTTLMDFFGTFAGPLRLALLVIFGAIALGGILIALLRRLTALDDRRRRRILLALTVLSILLQYVILFTFRAGLRYDHLMVFDEALEMMRTGKLSLTYGDAYFAQYPFNIPITIFNYAVLCAAKFLHVPESAYMLTIQCVYLASIDLGVFFSYEIIRILKSEKAASVFAVLVIINPLMYLYGFACYTTTLMIPCLMCSIWMFVLFLKEADMRRKLILGVLLGIVLILGIKIRANLLITIISFVGYLILHEKNAYTVLPNGNSSKYSSKLLVILFLAVSVAVGAAASYAVCMTIENHYVDGDYSETQVPIPYYFYFSSNYDSLGAYNDEDHLFIMQFPTVEEKKQAAWSALADRLKEYGPAKILRLADKKLSRTWSDGIDDYPDFMRSAAVYGKAYSFLAGDRKDLFALYCHIYHVMTMGLMFLTVLTALRKRCDSPFYVVGLNLLGAMMFHIIWEPGWRYSISFTLLILLMSAEALHGLLEGSGAAEAPANVDGTLVRRSGFRFSFPSRRSGFRFSFPSRRIGKIPVNAASISFAAAVIIGLTILSNLSGQVVKQTEYAVVQDMYLGDDLLPLETGNVITQTFVTGLPFNHVGVKASNPDQDNNTSVYRMELFGPDGSLIDSKDFSGRDVISKDYIYMKFDTVVPDTASGTDAQTYTIRVTALDAVPDMALTFLYYNSHNWDIYRDGKMTGLNAGEDSDLTFVVYNTVEKCFFN